MTDRQSRLKQMPTSFRKSYKKALKSKAFAIKSFCAECTGFDRKSVRFCTDTGCPLWPHRPYQNSDDDSAETDDREASEPEPSEDRRVGGQARESAVAKASGASDSAGSSSPNKRKCCDHPDIEKDGINRHCKNCDKRWKKKGSV